MHGAVLAAILKKCVNMLRLPFSYGSTCKTTEEEEDRSQRLVASAAKERTRGGRGVLSMSGYQYCHGEPGEKQRRKKRLLATGCECYKGEDQVRGR